MTAYEELWGIAEDHFGLLIVDRDCPRAIRGASRALRAEHENAGPRQIAFGDWERGAVAGFEAPLHPSPPPRSHPPGYAEVPRHENRTKSHERTACQERTISFTPAARAFSRSLGATSFSCPFVRLSCPAALRNPAAAAFSWSARSAARLLIRFIAHLLPPRALTRDHESRCRGIALCAI